MSIHHVGNLKILFHIYTAELLGFDDYIPPYVSASGQDILKGVNYASAAAGIREETGQHLVTILMHCLF